MRYQYQDIQIINKNGILMLDGLMISFQKCNETWKKMTKSEDSKGIGIRDITADSPYFKFFIEDMVIEILFKRTGIFKRKYNEKDFNNLWNDINQFGYSTFDMS